MTYEAKPLPFQPSALRGLSEKPIVSHHNYGGAVKRPPRGAQMIGPAVRILVAVTAAACAHGGVIAAESGKIIQGKALRELFAEHEFGDDVHFAYRFRGDGTFSGTEMGKDVRGTWRLGDRGICWTWTRPRGAEECYVARRNGAEISLFRNGVEQWYGTLKKIESRKP